MRAGGPPRVPGPLRVCVVGMTESQMKAAEDWFVARGVPHFIAEYRASEDVLTRSLPVLTVIFLFSAVSAIDLDWPAWGMAAAIAGGFGVLLAAWAALNRYRGRPPLSRPNSVGAAEIAAFLLMPTLLPVIFGGDWSGALVVFVSQVALLGLVYVATSYGVMSIAKWATVQAVRSLGETVVLFAKGLPVLLLGFMFLFINAEAWQSAGRLAEPLLAAIVGLFAVMASVFVVSQIPREVGTLARFASWQQLEELVASTPAAAAATRSTEAPDPPPLSRREWGNVGLVVLVSQTFRILAVAVLVGAFFVVFGMLAIRPETIAAWTEAEPVPWGAALSWFGEPVQITRELLQVSVFLGSFAGLYFSVYTITDTTFRKEFFEDIVDDIRRSLAVRAVYRQSRS